MIPITEESEAYIREVLSRYTAVEDECPRRFDDRTLLHLYPTRDTHNADGDLDGFQDALFFDVHIYDTDTKTRYTIADRDEIDLNVPCRIRYFKDGSTMLILDGPIELHPFQSMEITSDSRSDV